MNTLNSLSNKSGAKHRDHISRLAHFSKMLATPTKCTRNGLLFGR